MQNFDEFWKKHGRKFENKDTEKYVKDWCKYIHSETSKEYKDLYGEIKIILRLFNKKYREEDLAGSPEYVRSIRLLKKLKGEKLKD